MKWPDLNRIYVHPLFLLAGFVGHTAIAVLFGVYVAPLIAAGLGLTIVALALYWLAIALAIGVLALYRQSTMEGSIIAE